MTALSSCRQEADDLESQLFLETEGTSLQNNKPKTYTEQFDVLWNGMNQNYVAWQIEDYDWDEVYRTKRAVPQAWDARLKANPKDTVSDEDFKKFYEDIIHPLHDSHLNVRIWNFLTKQNTCHQIRPGYNRLKQRDNYKCFEKLIIVRQLLESDDRNLWTYTLEALDMRGLLEPITPYPHKDGKDASQPFITFSDTTSNLIAQLAVIKTTNGKYVPYMHWNRFYFSAILPKEKKADSLYVEGTASAFLKTYGDLVKTYGEAGTLGGVILDVRSNGGGNTGDYAHLLGRLLKPGTKMTLGNVVHKNGVGRLDYGPSTPFSFTISDYGQYVVTKEPIVVLCDGRSVSMSEITTYSVKLLPNGHIIGDRTYGGFNYLDQQYDRTYAGTFGDRSNGPLYVYAPCSLTTPIDGTKIEGVGIMPDEYIPYNDAIVNDMLQILNGTPEKNLDAHIEAAIKYIQGENKN